MQFVEPYHITLSHQTQNEKFSKETLKISVKKISFRPQKNKLGSLFSQHKQDINLFYKRFLDKITHLLDIYTPIKKLSFKEKKNLEKTPVDIIIKISMI